MKAITVFTSTYNRAYILGKCYESLNRQTCKDFEWLIIDDGSTDHTKKLVQQWQARDNGYEIRYIYQENGGLHTGYNTAIANMDTELSVCIDSDDAMPENGIERILAIWKTVEDPSVAGLVGLDYDNHGHLIGKLLPEERAINAASLLCNPGMGDKKYVLRNDLFRSVAPMPVYPGERDFNPHYFVIRLSEKYQFKPVNECFCLVAYQPDGMTANTWKQYVRSPKSFAELRRVILCTPGMTRKYRFKTAAHYVASSILAGNRDFLSATPDKFLTWMAIPAGLALCVLMRIKSK